MDERTLAFRKSVANMTAAELQTIYYELKRSQDPWAPGAMKFIEMEIRAAKRVQREGNLFARSRI